MRQIIAAKLIILAMETTIAVLICIIGYGIFFSPNGIFTMLAKTRAVIETGYQTEAETLTKMDEYINSFM